MHDQNKPELFAEVADPYLRHCLQIVQTTLTNFVYIGSGAKIAYRWLNVEVDAFLQIAAENGAGSSSTPLPQPPRRSEVPLLLHCDFRAGMDMWDPLFLAHLLKARPLIIFDPCHCGRSVSNRDTRPYMGSFYKWAKHAVAIADSLGMAEYDVLGFAMGGAAALLTALYPSPATTRVRKIVAAATTGPAISARLYEECSRSSMSIAWPRDDWNLMNASRLSLNDGNRPEEVKQAMKHTFFTESQAGQQALEQHWERINSFAQYRSKLPSEAPFIGLLEDRRELGPLRCQRLAWRSWETLPQQRGGAYTDPMAKVNVPVLVMNGINNTLIPASRSWELMCRLPKPALNLYEDSGAGFIWQYPERVAKDINYFLDYDHSHLQPQVLPSASLPTPTAAMPNYPPMSPPAPTSQAKASTPSPVANISHPYFSNTPTGHAQTHQPYLHNVPPNFHPLEHERLQRASKL
ncbi:chromatin remodeling complex subunit [Pseudozyma hubeiensis SY62]|uniref:Chromatin remodeling complex subunit n=1 Tax=Pseudozyma hubeiensis (strain SY62) TaxID=1305764 RepID=R9PAW3_PSEHS|nr:chromatin remodeling complex subunit [Pseudozyma hubeiensis SY62]GAC98516.1 chromatin remodeling complex subunit [Pseudozyma hubeiensis SY62]